MTDQNDFQFDMEGLKAALVAAGLDPAQPHDMRLFTNELGEPGTSLAEAAKRAGERKARAAQGSGFDMLNNYFEALRQDGAKPTTPSIGPGEKSGFETLSDAFADLRKKASGK